MQVLHIIPVNQHSAPLLLHNQYPKCIEEHLPETWCLRWKATYPDLLPK